MYGQFWTFILLKLSQNCFGIETKYIWCSSGTNWILFEAFYTHSCYTYMKRAKWRFTSSYSISLKCSSFSLNHLNGSTFAKQIWKEAMEKWYLWKSVLQFKSGLLFSSLVAEWNLEHRYDDRYRNTFSARIAATSFPCEVISSSNCQFMRWNNDGTN